MAILFGFAARCLFGLVFLQKAKQDRWLCADSTHKSLPHQRIAHRFIIKTPKTSSRHGYCGKMFWRFSVLVNLTCAKEPRWLVRVAWWTRTFYIRSSNRPFPSSKKSHLQSEAKCEAIDMKMILNYDANKTHFHNKGFALSLVLKVRFFGIRKWHIG